MSKLSKLLNRTFGNNAVKTGVILGSAYFGSKYLFTDPIGTAGGYNPDTLFGKVFNSIGEDGLTHFSDTSFGQSTLGRGITRTGELLGIGQGDPKELGPSFLSNALRGQFSKPPQVGAMPTGGFGARSDLNFQASRVNPYPIGRGGAFQNAIGNDNTLQYLARTVQNTIGAPSVSALPKASSAAAAPSISTTKSSRRAYSRVTST